MVSGLLTRLSTWRELKAVHKVLQSFTSKLKGHAVKWFSDNQAVVRIVQVGSGKPHLQEGEPCLFLNFALRMISS